MSLALVRSLRPIAKPDLAVMLLACPEVVHSRKPEIGIPELIRQQQAWADAPQQGKQNLIVDTTEGGAEQTSAVVAASVRELIDSHGR
jgi:hypothetical protein